MKAVDRAIAILEYLGSAKSACGVTDIGRALGLSKSVVHRTLSMLDAAQWVTQDSDTERYRIGNRMLELGLSILSNMDLRSASLPYLNQLRDATTETACLSLRMGQELIFIDQIQGGHEVRLVVALGRRLPMWCGAAGKAMLAYLPESELESVLDNLGRLGTQVLASGKVVDVDRLREELVETRTRGFAVASDERLLGASGVAAPIFAHDHTVLGAISVGGILPRFTPERATTCGPPVAQAARAISSRLGDSGRFPDSAR